MENGVEVFIYWNLASHKQEVFRDLDFSDVSLPETNKRCEEVLAIPVYPGLTNKERKTIVKLINDFKRSRDNFLHGNFFSHLIL